eukprot:4271932-Pyramimonas_sp.AAC.1
MWLSPWRRAHSSSELTAVSRILLVDVPRMVFWRDYDMLGCSNYVDSLLKSQERCSGDSRSSLRDSSATRGVEVSD